MKKMKAISALLLAVALVFMSAIAGFAPFMPSADAASAGTWISSWSTAAVNGSISLTSNIQFNDVIPAASVVRTQMQLSSGGLYTKLCFSNEYGTSTLKIGAVSIAKTDTKSTASILTDTATAVTFNDGQTSAEIKAGETLWSDSIYFPVSSLEYVTVSVYYPSTTYIKTAGLYGGRSFLNMAASKNDINNKSVSANSEIKISSGAITYQTIPFLTRIDVRSTYADAYSVVFLGDSTLTNETYHYFAQRAYTAGYSHVGFVNNSIVANRLLHKGTGLIGNLYGDAVVNRLGRDALNVTGAKVLLVKIGLNDILHPMTESMKGEAPYSSVDDIIAGYKQIISAARNKDMQVYFFTKSAWKGYEREFLGQTGDLTWTKEAQSMCDQLDAWIRSTNLIDGYFDMSPLDSPVDSNALLPALTSDGAHLTELGALAMADLISPEIIGANTLPTASSINGVNPYASRQSVIDAYNAAQATTSTSTTKNNVTSATTTTKISATTTTKNNVTTTTKQNNNNTSNVDEDASIAASVLASREEAANNANNAGRPATSTTAGTVTSTTKASSSAATTTKANSSNSITTTKANSANSTTAAANTTTAAGTTAKATTAAGTTAAGTTTAADTTAASAATTATEETGDNSTVAVVYNDTTAESFSISITLANGGEAAEMGAAQQPVIAEDFSSNGSSIGIVLIVVMVGMIAAAVIITMNGRRPSDR